MAKTFDGPPTLERSGSERRGGAVSSLFPEGERVGVRGGALFNGKEGRGDFRKSSTKGGFPLLPKEKKTEMKGGTFLNGKEPYIQGNT